MASYRDYQPPPRAQRIDMRPQGRSGYMPGDFSLTKRGALTPLQELYAENTNDPLTGMKVKPGKWEQQDAQHRLASSGDFEGLALLNRLQYAGSGERGDARGAIGSYLAGRNAMEQKVGEAGMSRDARIASAKSLGTFGATRDLYNKTYGGGGWQMDESGNIARGSVAGGGAAPQQSSSFPRQGMTNPYFKTTPEEQIGGMLSDAATKAFAPSGAGYNGSMVQNLPYIDNGVRVNPSEMIERGPYIDRGGSNENMLQPLSNRPYPTNPNDMIGKPRGLGLVYSSGGVQNGVQRAGGKVAGWSPTYSGDGPPKHPDDLRGQTGRYGLVYSSGGQSNIAPVAGARINTTSPYGSGSSTFVAKPSATAFTPDPQTLADMRSRRSAIRDVESPILGPSGPPPQTIQSSTIGLQNPYLQAPTPQVAQAPAPMPIAPVAPVAMSPADLNRRDYTQQRIQQLEDESMSGIGRLGRKANAAIAGAGINYLRGASSKIGGLINYSSAIPRFIAREASNVYRSPQVQSALFGDAAKKAELAQLKKALQP